jgi:hypothetical protein
LKYSYSFYDSLVLLGTTLRLGSLKIAYGFVILEIQMVGNQGNAVCWKNNGDKDKSRECSKCSARISGEKRSPANNDRA